MLVFSKAKLVFLSVPKTGTTAYETALAPHAAIVVSDPPDLKHTPVFRYNRFFRPMLEKFIGEDLEIIAVMREPASWLGSWYRYRQRPFMRGKSTGTHNLSFEDFVTGYCANHQPDFANVGSQAKFLTPSRNGTAVTRLFRYEDPEALNTFLEERLETKIETQRENVSPDGDLTLSRKSLSLLRETYAEDFRLYEGLD